MDARKAGFAEDEARALLADARWAILGRGTKFEKIDLKDADPSEISARMLGRSGTLRAPTVRSGKTLLVGWCQSAWEEHFGA